MSNCRQAHGLVCGRSGHDRDEGRYCIPAGLWVVCPSCLVPPLLCLPGCGCLCTICAVCAHHWHGLSGGCATWLLLLSALPCCKSVSSMLSMFGLVSTLHVAACKLVLTLLGDSGVPLNRPSWVAVRATASRRLPVQSRLSAMGSPGLCRVSAAGIQSTSFVHSVLGVVRQARDACMLLLLCA